MIVTINDVQFNITLEEVFDELQRQLEINQIPYFQKGYRQSGEHIMVQCPYHGGGQERKPSAGMRKSDGSLHCFACGARHSLPEVVSWCFGYVDDILGKQGWKWLLKNFATIQKEERNDINLDFSRNTGRSRRRDDSSSINGDTGEHSRFVSDQELDRYRYYHKYWTKRGITNKRLIELFDLGYDYGTDCITFPVRDVDGNCLFVARRSVKTKWFNYPKGAEKPLYGLYEFKRVQSEVSKGVMFMKYPPEMLDKFKEIIVTESMLDALSFWQIGRYAVALNGTGNELQFKQLREGGWRKIILATDNDRAGKEARSNIRNNVKNKLITEFIFPFGKKDANECSEKQLKNLEEVF